MGDKEKTRSKPISAAFEISIDECVAHFERLIDALRSGVVDIQAGERSARLTPNGMVNISLAAQCRENKEALQLKLAWPVGMKNGSARPEESTESLATTEDLRSAFRSAFQQGDYRRAHEIGAMIVVLYPQTLMAAQYRQIQSHLRRTFDDRG